MSSTGGWLSFLPNNFQRNAPATSSPKKRTPTRAITKPSPQSVQQAPELPSLPFPARKSSLPGSDATPRQAEDGVVQDLKVFDLGEAVQNASHNVIPEEQKEELGTTEEDEEDDGLALRVNSSRGKAAALKALDPDASSTKENVPPASSPPRTPNRSQSENSLVQLGRTLSRSKRPNSDTSSEEITANRRSASFTFTPLEDSDASSTKKSRRSIGSMSRLRRKSWALSSREPSPDRLGADPDAPPLPANASAIISKQDQLNASPKRPSTSSSSLRSSMGLKQSSKQPSFSKQIAHKMRQKHLQTTTADHNTSDDAASIDSQKSRASLTKSQSTDRIALPALIPSNLSSDRLVNYVPSDMFAFSLSSKTRLARKRDDLWAVFRDLDSACPRFQAKTAEQKGTVLRTALLPFLKEYERHASNFKLHADDLGRRTDVLYRWWSVLLEFLKSRNFTLTSNSVRTMVLEGISGIMQRPEWRHFPSPFSVGLGKRNSDAISEANSSQSEGEFTIESVQAQIKRYFSECLLSQMQFVVDKMSTKAIPSVVNFCGVTCAYVFFFCPGAARFLVQLWKPKVDDLKKILEMNGLAATSNLSEGAEKLSAQLPSTLRTVQFTSLKDAIKELRRPAAPPAGTEDMAWRGTWVERWSGQESELFYTFVKQYYVLLFEYVPEPSKSEVLSSAGAIYIQAQLLANMKAVIQRHNPKGPDAPPPPTTTRSSIANAFSPQVPNSAESVPSADETRKPANITFDDVLGDADTPPPPANPSLPAPLAAPTNADRSMSENRLIALLREVLVLPRQEVTTALKDAFAQLFADLLSAVAKCTGQFQRFAADALCDLLEEAVVVLVKYEQTNGITKPFLDWSFWFGVFKLMIDSNSSSTEIRVYCLLYSLWPAISVSAARRTELCQNLLLERSFFESRFCHWSPMLRSYYMRLLVWRVGRCSEDVTQDDIALLRLLMERLTHVYADYLHWKNRADQNSALVPPTHPAYPAPGRRFIIVRTDHTQSTRTGAMVTFDAPVTPHNAAYKRSLLLEQLCAMDLPAEQRRPTSALSVASSTASSSDRDLEDSPKRWTGGLLRTIMGGTKPAKPAALEGNKISRHEDDLPVRRPMTTHNGTAHSPKSSTTKPIDRDFNLPSTQPFRTYCFRYSLEPYDRRHGPQSSIPLQLPRLPQPAQLILSNHLRAQALKGSKSVGTSETLLADAFVDDDEDRALLDPNSSLIRCSTTDSLFIGMVEPSQSSGLKAAYCGRALAEWTILVNECHGFFERRKTEGVPGNRWVETPLLFPEIIKRTM